MGGCDVVTGGKHLPRTHGEEAVKELLKLLHSTVDLFNIIVTSFIVAIVLLNFGTEFAVMGFIVVSLFFSVIRFFAYLNP